MSFCGVAASEGHTMLAHLISITLPSLIHTCDLEKMCQLLKNLHHTSARCWGWEVTVERVFLSIWGSRISDCAGLAGKPHHNGARNVCACVPHKYVSPVSHNLAIVLRRWPAVCAAMKVVRGTSGTRDRARYGARYHAFHQQQRRLFNECWFPDITRWWWWWLHSYRCLY